ncbi:unnamed protein product [Notodromas monacha]|uniref:NADH dehydrogenase [ubiquinone] 1 beta subcomplex subunit 5, mitochondrial n=1 Tax=Notodromas monacha TaxID=399045 RepID=A0A7R9BGI9_9CRUS|nr:unnamed protein product [Notodromas monacha]CAG0914884.1 unnamed protein product [Notodromas monacha]
MNVLLLSWIGILSLCLSGSLKGATAIKCYQCSSAEDAKGEDSCGVYEGFDESKNDPVECTSDESVTPGTFCVKITKQSPRGFIWDGRWRQVIRRCGSVSEVGVTGVCNWGLDENSVYWEECYCSEDACVKFYYHRSMAVFSSLRSSSKVLNSAIVKKFLQSPQCSKDVRRNSGHLMITASRWQWTKSKDLMHFYLFVGLIPVTIAITALNVFVGPATLSEIPEDYEPEEYEYYESPVTRFLVKNFGRTYQEDYERTLHFVNRIRDRGMLRKTQTEVEDFMQQRNDYKAYYYRPVLAKFWRATREDAEFVHFVRGEQ